MQRMRETTIHLIRHGQSEANLERRLSSRPPGPGLTPLGRRQAEAARDLLLRARRAPDVILTSPMRRTLETAAPLSAAVGIAPVRMADLVETRFGVWDGWQVDELLRASRAFRDWMVDPEVTPPPEGEPLSSVARRVRACLTRVAQAHPGQTVAAFSHMHALQGFLMLVEGLPWSRHPEIAMPNAAVVTARYSPTGWRIDSVDTSAALAGADREVS